MPTSQRPFYKTTLTVIVLSEEPTEFDGLSDIARMGVDGDYSVSIPDTKAERIDGPTAAEALQAQDSDPEFFGLTPQGYDLTGEFDAGFALTLHNGDQVTVTATGQVVTVNGDPYLEEGSDPEVVMVPTVAEGGAYHLYPHTELS
jgi:hypothetical protein